MTYFERIDKIISSHGKLSRREVKAAALKGRISVNGKPIKDPGLKVRETDNLTLDGFQIIYHPFVYIMMNKPEGYVSSNDQPGLPTVFDLLTDAERKRGLFCVGRLDRDTVGLLILTNDGDAAHQLLSPKKHVEKTYYFESAEIVSDDDAESLINGLELADGLVTKETKLELFPDRRSGLITLTEGKYHQIKRMFGATGNKITFLERKRLGEIFLDNGLKRGEWRELTNEEQEILLKFVIRR